MRQFVYVLAAALPFFAMRFIGVVPSGGSAYQEPIADQIRTVHQQMRVAAGRADAVDLYTHVLDTDAPPIIENGVVQPTRAVALTSTAENLRAVSSIAYSYSREHVTVLSPTVALWVGEGSATARLSDGRDIVAAFAETVVFVKREGRWMVLHAHRSAPAQR